MHNLQCNEKELRHGLLIMKIAVCIEESVPKIWLLFVVEFGDFKEGVFTVYTS